MRNNISQYGAGPGRPRGSLNKVNVALREMILASLDQTGGLDYLVRQSEANPGPYLALLAKVLPKEITATVETRAYIVAPEQAASMEAWAGQVQVAPDDGQATPVEGE